MLNIKITAIMDGKTEKKVKKIVFFIGKQKFETEKATLSVKEILVDFAKVNPEEKSLALKQGNDHHEYTNIEEVIEMKEGMHFVLFDKTPTTAS
jgi:hypothetical protein